MDEELELEEQLNNTSPAYLLRNLSVADMLKPTRSADEGQTEDNKLAPFCSMLDNRLAVRLIVAQCAYFSACAAHAPFVPPHPDTKTAPPVIGVVGCGQLGTQMLRSLLALGWPPALLAACSRNQANFEKFRKVGVQCTTDCAKLAAWDQGAGGCRAIILCVPHAQLRTVCASLTGSRGRGISRAIIINNVAGVHFRKLKKLLPRCPQIVCTRLNLPVIRAQSMTKAADDPGAHGAPSPEFMEEAAREHMLLDQHILDIFDTFERLYMASGAKPEAAREIALLKVIGYVPEEAKYLMERSGTGALEPATESGNKGNKKINVKNHNASNDSAEQSEGCGDGNECRKPDLQTQRDLDDNTFTSKSSFGSVDASVLATAPDDARKQYEAMVRRRRRGFEKELRKAVKAQETNVLKHFHKAIAQTILIMDIPDLLGELSKRQDDRESQVLSTSRGGSRGDGGGSGVATALTATSRPGSSSHRPGSSQHGVLRPGSRGFMNPNDLQSDLAVAMGGISGPNSRTSSREGGVRVTEVDGEASTPHSRPGSAALHVVTGVEIDPNGRPLTSDLYGTGVRPDTSGLADVHDDEGVAQKQFERGQWAQVTIFGNPQSELCQELLNELNANDIEYNLVDVDRDIEQLKHVAAAVGRDLVQQALQHGSQHATNVMDGDVKITQRMAAQAEQVAKLLAEAERKGELHAPSAATKAAVIDSAISPVAVEGRSFFNRTSDADVGNFDDHNEGKEKQIKFENGLFRDLEATGILPVAQVGSNGRMLSRPTINEIRREMGYFTAMSSGGALKD